MPEALRSLSACFLLVAIACGDGETGDPARMDMPSRATVTFVYSAATELNAEVAEEYPACVGGVGHTHIHPGWRDFDRVDMAEGAGGWTITFDDVPVGSRERIRISDANVCSAENRTGAATASVVANGVPLTDVVDTPGTGTEPGLAFTVAADGTVTP
jgi:hypothetical protein